MNLTCPWCKAPREEGPRCPACGAIYAKAEAIKAHGRAPVAALTPALAVEPMVDVLPTILPAGLPDDSPLEQPVEDWGLEYKYCLGAIPLALLLGIVLHAWTLGFLVRLAFTMPVHEAGHAITGWFCGFFSIPTLWKTIIPETRGFVAPVLLLGWLGYMAYRAHQAGRLSLVALAGILVAIQAVGTLAIKERTAHMLITFGGDGGAMILSTLLMGSFFFGKKTQLYHGWLRWGFVVIGASAFIDTSATWWAARNDMGAIPF